MSGLALSFTERIAKWPLGNEASNPFLRPELSASDRRRERPFWHARYHDFNVDNEEKAPTVVVNLCP